MAIDTDGKLTRTQLDRRDDGRYSATLKLIAWNVNELRALASVLYGSPMGRQAGTQLAEAVRDAMGELQPLETLQIAQEAAGGVSPPDVGTDTSETDE
jgi:hypothetical protein|tara:strand:- start:1711 stop:2004 length:294 start_codon:yes stop_codon:yes gene_type:complete